MSIEDKSKPMDASVAVRFAFEDLRSSSSVFLKELFFVILLKDVTKV